MNPNSCLFLCFTAISEALDYDTNLKVKSNFKTFFFAFECRCVAYVSKAEPASIAHFLWLATSENKNFCWHPLDWEKNCFLSMT